MKARNSASPRAIGFTDCVGEFMLLGKAVFLIDGIREPVGAKRRSCGIHTDSYAFLPARYLQKEAGRAGLKSADVAVNEKDR
jgi:hypothetical protein